jgi:hypothetical protein
MTSEKAPERIIAGAKEAVAIAAGEKPAHRLHINGHTYVPADIVAAKDARIAELEAVILSAADTCDKWAEQSQAGAWSTHQVSENHSLADSLRRAALSREGE